MEGESNSTVTVVSLTTSQNVFTSNPAMSDQSGGRAAPSSSGTAVAVITGTFTELPPTYEESESTIQTPADAVGEHNPFTGHASDRAAIYGALYDGSKVGGGRADSQTGRYVQLQEGHSNGWYDGCFTRSCVCDYTGRHVIPEYITSGSLYRGRVLGWKIFREMTLPMVGNALRIFWTLLQLVLALALLILSSINFAGGRRSIYNIVHLTLSAIAMLLASFDFGGSIINKILGCRSNNTYTRMHNSIGSSESLALEDEQSAVAINTTSTPTRRTRSCVSDSTSKFSYVDIARLIIPEMLLFPIVICDVYMLVNEDIYRLESNSDWISFVELLVSVCTLVVLVYIVRITLLGVMTYRVYTKRALPKELHLTQEAIIGAGCDPKIRRNGLIYLLFLIFNVVTHMVNQVAMILAIGLKIHEYIIADDSSHFFGYHNGPTNPNKLPFNFWFMIAAGYVLPIAGAWLFFSVTHFWLQEFAIGIAVDYLGMLKLPGAACLFFSDHSPYEARSRANKILSHNKYDRLRQDYHALRNENPLAKAFYPFKSFSHTLMCLGYSVIQFIFVYVTAFSIQGKQLNMGIFLFVIITELLSNVYVLFVSLFWIVVGAAILTAILLVLGLSVKCIICVAIFCSSYFDSLNRGPPEPPVMTPQIRMGLQQV